MYTYFYGGLKMLLLILVWDCANLFLNPLLVSFKLVFLLAHNKICVRRYSRNLTITIHGFNKKRIGVIYHYKSSIAHPDRDDESFLGDQIHQYNCILMYSFFKFFNFVLLW